MTLQEIWFIEDLRLVSAPWVLIFLLRVPTSLWKFLQLRLRTVLLHCCSNSRQKVDFDKSYSIIQTAFLSMQVWLRKASKQINKQTNQQKYTHTQTTLKHTRIFCSDTCIFSNRRYVNMWTKNKHGEVLHLTNKGKKQR